MLALERAHWSSGEGHVRSADLLLAVTVCGAFTALAVKVVVDLRSMTEVQVGFKVPCRPCSTLKSVASLLHRSYTTLSPAVPKSSIRAHASPALHSECARISATMDNRKSRSTYEEFDLLGRALA